MMNPPSARKATTGVRRTVPVVRPRCSRTAHSGKIRRPASGRARPIVASEIRCISDGGRGAGWEARLGAQSKVPCRQHRPSGPRRHRGWRSPLITDSRERDPPHALTRRLDAGPMRSRRHGRGRRSCGRRWRRGARRCSTLIPRLAAISALLSPAATAASTSSSRVVRPPGPADPGAGASRGPPGRRSVGVVGGRRGRGRQRRTSRSGRRPAPDPRRTGWPTSRAGARGGRRGARPRARATARAGSPARRRDGARGPGRRLDGSSGVTSIAARLAHRRLRDRRRRRRAEPLGRQAPELRVAASRARRAPPTRRTCPSPCR